MSKLRPLFLYRDNPPKVKSPTLTTADYFNRAQYADILIKYGSRTKPCHKLIICTRSDYFGKLCGSESKFAEANESCIELKHDNEDAVEAMLEWLYTSDYKVPEIAVLDNIYFHMQVHIVADKYGLDALNEEALKRFNATLETCSLDDAETLVTRAWLEDESLPKALEVAFTSFHDRTLHALLKKPSFRKAVCQYPDKAEAILARYSSLTRQVYKKCGRCKMMFAEAHQCTRDTYPPMPPDVKERVVWLEN